MTRDNRSVLIGCIYKSPNTSDTNKDKLIDLLRSPLIQSFNYVCIVGDFNYPDGVVGGQTHRIMILENA